ncbi:MAG: LD-carboxypeptidase [Candidatus Acidiferrales bacterium]
MPMPLKPRALRPGDAIRVIAPSSPVEAEKLEEGIAELERLGYRVKRDSRALSREGYFAGGVADRVKEFLAAIGEPETRAVICARGGYGSNYLLDELLGEIDYVKEISPPKMLIGYSDVTSLQVFLWEKCGWVTFYGPMVAAGFDAGENLTRGYDRASFEQATSTTSSGWTAKLEGETLVRGTAEGPVLGGCLTLILSTLGTPWAINSKGAILALEDRGMKPWQVDRALMHLKQAGKLDRVAGLLFGDFPECEGPAGSATVRDVISRVTRKFDVPVVWNVPFGHTERPMLTIPLGVRARLTANASPTLEFLEAACTDG